MQNVGINPGLSDAVFWLVLVVALIIGFWVAWFLMRKWFFNDNSAKSASIWSLQELRNLREQEQITEHEFETLRKQIIGNYKDRESSDQTY